MGLIRANKLKYSIVLSICLDIYSALSNPENFQKAVILRKQKFCWLDLVWVLEVAVLTEANVGCTHPKASVRSLDVLLDPGLFLPAQVAAVARRAYYVLCLVRQLHPFLNNKGLPWLLIFWSHPGLLIVMHSIWRCHWRPHGNWHNLNADRQNRFYCIGPFLRELCWILVAFRAQVKVLVITYKTLYGKGTGYLKDHLTLHWWGKPYPRSHQLPRIAWWGVRVKVFLVVALWWWYSLPREAHLASMLAAFKKNLEDSSASCLSTSLLRNYDWCFLWFVLFNSSTV